MNSKIEKQPKKSQTETAKTPKRAYISQADIPSCQLSEALRVVEAIADNYGKKPTKPLQVAGAMGILPTSSNFKMFCGASIAYGLTDGGYNVELISLTPLAKRIVAPTVEGDDLHAKQEATLKPRIIREFLKKYDGSPLPNEAIGCNVLEDMGVPAEKTKKVLELILESAEEVGFIKNIKEKKFIDLGAIPETGGSDNSEDEPENTSEEIEDQEGFDSSPLDDEAEDDINKDADVEKRLSRVFITHGKNKVFIDPIRKILEFGGFESVVAVEKQTTSGPVPKKIMSEMQSCGAALIHIEAEQKLIDAKGAEQVVLNPNVLIEIGAAMALYGERFVLLVKEGVELPSNLQGLYEVRYSGDLLNSEETMKLLEAINDIKNHPLP